jgi:micrococcal nuclease
MVVAISAVVILSVPWYLAQRNAGLRPMSSGQVLKVVDGDTLDISGVGRVRLVGVNTPEQDQPGYMEALTFLEETCLGLDVSVDIDDRSPKDHYGRILAVVYVGEENINSLLLRSGHAEVLYLPPSEFDPNTWK